MIVRGYSYGRWSSSRKWDLTKMNRTLIDTREPFDAGLCGYDGPRDPLSGLEGLIVELTKDDKPPCVMLTGVSGSVELCGLAEIREVAKSLTAVVDQLTRAAKHNPKQEPLL